MGTQLLQGQMEVQEQVLEYQYVKFFFVLFLKVFIDLNIFVDVRRMYE
jgi:hypothetical protein